MLQLLLCNYNTFPFFPMYLHAEDGENIHTGALKFCWLITCKFNTLIFIYWKTFSEMFPLQQLIHMATENNTKRSRKSGKSTPWHLYEVYWHGHWTCCHLIAASWHRQPRLAGLQVCKGTEGPPQGTNTGLIWEEEFSPPPWEYCPAEHCKADTVPPAASKALLNPPSHTVLAALAQLHRKAFLVTSLISPAPPAPSSSASDEFSASSALDQPSFSSDASREWDGLAQPWGRNSQQLTEPMTGRNVLPTEKLNMNRRKTDTGRLLQSLGEIHCWQKLACFHPSKRSCGNALAVNLALWIYVKGN